MAVNIDFRVKNGLAVSTTATVESSTQSLSTNSGALQVFGGAGIAKNLYVGGYSNIAGVSTFTNITNSVSTATGALVVAGGAGVGGNLYVGGNVSVAGIINASIVGIITTATNINNGDAGQIPYQQYTGKTDFITTGTPGTVLVSYGAGTPTFQNTLTLSGSANATSTITGAFRVIGGAGIGGNLYVGGTIYGNGSLTGLITTATNIAAGTSGQILYQQSPGVTSFVGTGTIGQLLMSSGTSAPLYVNTSSILIGYSVNAFTSTNIIGGAVGSIPYQNGTGTTTMLPLSTAGYFLLAGTSSPFWQDPRSIFINTATNLANGLINQIPYQSTPGVTGFFGPGTIGQVLVSAGTSTGGPVFSSTLTLSSSLISTNTNTGALQVIGGVGIGGNLYIGGDIGTTNSTFNLLNTSATTVNFAGSATSVNIGGTSGVTTVKNNLTILGNLTVQGTSTVVDSTVTNITDPILTLGGLSSNQPLTVNDNKDKGIAFKYFSGSAKTGFFGFDDSTGFFTFVPDATITNEIVSGSKGAVDVNLAGGTSQALVYQSGPNVTAFLAAGTAGNILQTNGTGSAPTWANTLTLSGTTNATSTTTGAFQVVGGAGIGGNLYVGGNSSVASTVSSTSTTTGALVVAGGVGIRGDMYIGGTIYGIVNGSITTATNIAGGLRGQILYQQSPGVTSFVGTGTIGQLLMSSGTSAPLYVNTSAIFVGYADKAITAVTATNITAGTSGQLLYQQSPGVTSFVGTGTIGQLLMSSGTSAPLYVNTSAIFVGYADKAITAVTANNIAAGTSGQIPYQSSPGITSFAGPGSIGQLLMSSGTSAPLYVNTSAIFVGYADKAITAVTATNIALGNVGQLHYQSAPGVTNFVGAGFAGQVLVSSGNTSTGPAFQNTLTLAGTTNSTSTATGALQVVGGMGIGKDLYIGGNIYGSVVGSITTATNLALGTSGQIPYQNSPGITQFAGPGSIGQLLVSAGASSTGPVFTTTSSIFVGYSDRSNLAITATNIAAGSAGQIHYQSSTGTTAFAGPGTSGNVLVSNGTNAPTYNSTLTLASNIASTSTITGALQVVGGIGVGGSVYVGNRVGFVGTTQASVVYQYYNSLTNSLDTVFG